MKVTCNACTSDLCVLLSLQRKAIQKKPQQEEGDDTAKSSQQPVTGGEGTCDQ